MATTLTGRIRRVDSLSHPSGKGRRLLPVFVPHGQHRKITQDRITAPADQSPAMRADVEARGDGIRKSSTPSTGTPPPVSCAAATAARPRRPGHHTRGPRAPRPGRRLAYWKRCSRQPVGTPDQQPVQRPAEAATGTTTHPPQGSMGWRLGGKWAASEAPGPPFGSAGASKPASLCGNPGAEAGT